MENKTFDVDLMAIMGHFSEDQANDILVETEYPGFYFTNDLNDQLWKVVDIQSKSCIISLKKQYRKY